MDYYQGVVLEYLRADRSIFVNPECCIQLNAANNPDGSGPHWYCDLLAVDFETHCVWLCEVSYSKSLAALLKRLGSWKSHWPAVKASLVRDCHLDANWQVRPWVFVPESCVKNAVAGIERLGVGMGLAHEMRRPKMHTLESVAPWKYPSWNRTSDVLQPACIPPDMRE